MYLGAVPATSFMSEGADLETAVRAPDIGAWGLLVGLAATLFFAGQAGTVSLLPG
jgi:hypothetical protein